MRRLDMAAALSLVALFALTGCSDDGSSPDPAPTGQADAGFSVTGTFRVSGGPAPGIDKPLGGTVTFGGPVSEEVSAGNGTFAVTLPPGKYIVTGHPDGHFAAATCPSFAAIVVGEQTSPVEVTCVVE